jgi:integrase
MAEAQKPSSRALYEGKWRIFADWCAGRDFDPLQASVPTVADFLCDLHDNKNLVYSTVEGYRTAISNVFKHVQGVDLGKNVHLTALFANFARDASRRRPSAPSWNLAVVLQAMTQAPFEPLVNTSLKLLTFKTVFLITLASGCRRSEVHAFTRASFMRDEDWTSVSVAPGMDFVAKTELINKGPAIISPVTFRALTDFLSPDMEEDTTLCPVRALKLYLARTDKLRTTQKRLFIAFKVGHTQDICKNTVSGWLKKAILAAYSFASEDTRTLHGVKAHEVRAMAASWAFLRNASIESILGACRWKSHSTFSSFYLRDLTSIQDEMLRLGPVVAALHRS